MRFFNEINHYDEKGLSVFEEKEVEIDTNEPNTKIKINLTKAKEEIDVLYNILGILETDSPFLRKVPKNISSNMKKGIKRNIFMEAALSIRNFIKKEELEENFTNTPCSELDG